jgi:hypothetical protein
LGISSYATPVAFVGSHSFAAPIGWDCVYVPNVVLYDDSSSKAICQYPFFASNVENIFAPGIIAAISSTVFMG